MNSVRISLLSEREPFGSILEETLSRFWSRRLEQDVTVTWESNAHGTSGHTGKAGQIWLVNSNLNAIFVPDADRAIFEPIRREFTDSLVWWRRPIQRAYVTAALSPIGARWLAQARVQVTPQILQAQQTLIIAGNHKIRVLDGTNGRSYGILKSGFTPIFMQRELAARQLGAELGLSIPWLDSVSEDASWFSEELLNGTPINRLSNPEQAQQALAEALNQLDILKKATLDSIDLGDYLDSLKQQALALAGASRLLNVRDRLEIETSISVLARQAQDQNGDEVLHTAQTHGDFQPANILVDAERIWLIDWEYAGRRQVAYDLLVYGLAARFPQGLAKRVSDFIERGVLDSVPFEHVAQTETGRTGSDDRKKRAALFLLEELVLRLEENAQPMFTRRDHGLSVLMNEVNAWTNAKCAK